jgi:hypothetical protein
MTRLATTVDRLAAAVFGLALIAVGVGVLVWNTHLIPHVPHTITAPGLVSATNTEWWPWAVAGVGLVLALVGLRWLFAHTPKARVKALPLPPTAAGSTSVDLGQVADAAATALQHDTNSHGAKGKAVIDRGSRTIDLAVTAYSPATVPALIAAVDEVGGQVTEMLGDARVAVRTTVHVDKHGRRDRVS